MLLHAAAPAVPPPDRSPEQVARSLTERLAEERRAAGLSALDPRASLAEVARSIAGEIASLPEGERLSRDAPTVESVLRAAGLPAQRARRHVEMQLGSPDPVGNAFLRWRNYGPSWRDALDPRMDAVGIGGAVAADGWLILVAILVEDLPGEAAVREMERRLGQAVNRDRAGAGLPPLEWSEAAASLARGHSADMAARGYFAHVTPEGRDVVDRARRAGIAHRFLAENIALSQGVDDPVATAIQVWRESPGHRANMRTREATVAGVGAALSADGTLYFTQVFLRPDP